MQQLTKLRMTKKSIKFLLSLMIFISPMLVLQIGGKEAFLWIQILFVIIMAVNYKKISFYKSPFIVAYFLEPFITAFFAHFSTMPDSYKSTAINLAIMSIPLYFVIGYLNRIIKKEFNVLETVIKALKLAIIVELIWVLGQLLFYRVFGIDINKFIFVDMLHLVENASFIRSWVWYPSGLCWHSAVLAPLFVMGILFFDNSLIRAVIIIEAFLCGNSTTLIGVLASVFLLLIYSFFRGKFKLSKKKIITVVILIIAMILVLLETNMKDKIIDVAIKLWIRLFGGEKDASTAAHFGYYSDYITILKKSSLSQILWGYGIGCSGYTITSLYGRYANGGTWAIESDYINILVSRGIIGFINYYLFLFYIMIKGAKIDARYFIFMLVILIQGFGYNIQFDFLFLIEVVLFICVKKNINFFNIVDEVNKKKRD